MVVQAKLNQVIRLAPRSLLNADIGAFVIDRQARGLSPCTVLFYRKELGFLAEFLQSCGRSDVQSVMADDLRRYLLSLSSRNPGGVHAAYRAMRAFFRWYEDEVEIQNWRNPIAKVKAPRVNVESLDPVSLDDVRAMLIQCPRSLCGDRDRAILLCLLDTGCRAAEFVALDVGDVNLASGQVVVRAGKGGKSRTVFLGAKSRRELNRYLRRRRVKLGDSLWLSQDGTRLTYAGLREVVRRLARAADIPCPSLHSFRRAFAIGCLRNGVDLVSLQRLMGHADLTVLRRYLAQVADDLGVAHAKGSPVDNML